MQRAASACPRCPFSMSGRMSMRPKRTLQDKNRLDDQTRHDIGQGLAEPETNLASFFFVVHGGLRRASRFAIAKWKASLVRAAQLAVWLSQAVDCGGDMN